ncbi:hypothetical protein SLEP1_g5361 [Rubroshorea leprosula]|uniref:RING-type domain-containing protein n=1 Tax=Rubroshorea leprosula TaxID=152421 RepID=A0AAV5I2H7_9ROSI|nr:hypothetical protein SLEP1_g5361 [Rubroshorea leprosula]
MCGVYNSSDSFEIFGKLSTFDGIVLFIGVPAVLIFIILVVCICHPRRPRSSNANLTHTGSNGVSITVEGGRDKEILHGCSKLLYSQAKLQKADCSSSCSICLDEYRDADMLRLLSGCGHIFHQGCVDPWLMLHPTCPVCRNSPPSTAPNK